MDCYRLTAGQSLILSILRYEDNVIRVPAVLEAKMERVQVSMIKVILDTVAVRLLTVKSLSNHARSGETEISQEDWKAVKPQARKTGIPQDAVRKVPTTYRSKDE
jgi:1-aminocyclopropane-1-carboxylate deaminase/D-cysteine desulfhydrase-like pyridoxal-dependent ACC family enzyme